MDSLSWIALGLIFTVIVLVLSAIVALHMMPGKIAKANNHPQAKAIEMCSLMGLIIFPFWMVAIVWANYNPPRIMRPDDTPTDAEPDTPTNAGADAATDLQSKPSKPQA